MTTLQISEQVRRLILEGELDDAANTLVQFFDKEWMSRADKEQVQLYNQDTRKQNFAEQTVYFFKIQEGEYTGWVRQIQLAFTSPACLQ